MNKEQLLKAIQAMDFARHETVLFLDTHPDCKTALEYFHKMTEDIDRAKAEYESKYGPLCVSGVQGEGWTWVNSPWPWHIDMSDIEKSGMKSREAK